MIFKFSLELWVLPQPGHSNSWTETILGVKVSIGLLGIQGWAEKCGASWISSVAGETNPLSGFKKGKLKWLYEDIQDSCSSQKTAVLGHVNEGDRCVDLFPVWGGHKVVEGLLGPTPRAQHCLGWRNHHQSHSRIPSERKMGPHHINFPGLSSWTWSPGPSFHELSPSFLRMARLASVSPSLSLCFPERGWASWIPSCPGALGE